MSSSNTPRIRSPSTESIPSNNNNHITVDGIPIKRSNSGDVLNHQDRRLSMAKLATTPLVISNSPGRFGGVSGSFSQQQQQQNHSPFDSNFGSFYNSPRNKNYIPQRLNSPAPSNALDSSGESEEDLTTAHLNSSSSVMQRSGSNSNPLLANYGSINNNTGNKDSSGNLLSSSANSSILEDQNILKNLNKHLPTNDTDNALKLQGGDITRDLYKLPQKKRNSNTIRRSRSFSESERRGSTASSIRLPGGFRRDFLINQKNMKYGHKIENATFLTRNFLEFLSIYGHFAGEDLEDEDFLSCSYADMKQQQLQQSDEEEALLPGSSINQLKKSPSKREHRGTASTMKSFFLLLKGFIGTGVLFLPRAFLNGGLTLSILFLIFFALLSFWCYLILVYSKVATGVSSFGDIGDLLYGKSMKILILASIVLSQIGFVAAYTVFTAENLRAFMINVFGLNYSISTYVIFECLILMPLALFRNITKLSLAALLANIFILCGLVTIVIYASIDLIDNGPGVISNFNEDWTLFIGVAIFAFEGIGLILPVHESMKYPEQYPKVLFAVIAVCSVLFIGIGSLGYITYGADVKTVVILNLPQDSLAVNSIQFFYALAIMLSAPIQILPAIRIMESRIFKRRQSGKIDNTIKWLKNSFRIIIVILTCILAYFGSNQLDKFVSFVGSFACIPLVYMYPPMLHYKSCAKSKFMKLFDIFLVVFGGIAMVYTTFQLFI
ncbi:hypothetical protein B5S32_g2583 [[Candida] boidinii]|nr:hypothetical protein B5S32_g2583 [[Candida] boidinii]